MESSAAVENDKKSKPMHKCPKCDRTFGNIGHMKCHFYRVHPEFKLAEFEVPEAKPVYVEKTETFELEEESDSEPEPAPKPKPETKPAAPPVNQMPLNKIQQLLFKCEKCCKCFTKKASLLKHAMSNHGEERPFRCETCDKSFPNEARLKAHEATHRRNRPCRECAKTPSKTRCTHRRKQFACRVCKRAFLYRSCLKTHERTHKDEEDDEDESEEEQLVENIEVQQEKEEPPAEVGPYRSYRRKPNRISHGASKLKCKICNKTFSRECNLARHAVMHKPDPDVDES